MRIITNSTLDFKQYFINISSSLMIIALVFHYINGYYLENELFTFLNAPKARFGDWLQDAIVVSNFSPYINPGDNGRWANQYPPFAYMQDFFINNHLVKNSFPIFASLFISISLLINIYLTFFKDNIKNYQPIDRKIAFLVCITLNFPMMFAVDRGAASLIVYIYFMLAFLIFDNNKYLQPSLIGLAAATKIFPILFLFKYFFNKEYMQFFIGILTALLITLLCFYAFNDGFLLNIKYYLLTLAQRSSGITFSHGQHLWFCSDLWGFLQILYSIICKIFNLDFNFLITVSGNKLLLIYNIITIILFFIGGILIKNASNINQYIYYITSIIFIQPYSYDYNLIYILVLISYICFISNDRVSPFTFLLLILLVAPKTYALVSIGEAGIGRVQLSAIINPIIIFAIYFSIFKKESYEKGSGIGGWRFYWKPFGKKA